VQIHEALRRPDTNATVGRSASAAATGAERWTSASNRGVKSRDAPARVLAHPVITVARRAAARALKHLALNGFTIVYLD
jgi:hypothetical protein